MSVITFQYNCTSKPFTLVIRVVDNFKSPNHSAQLLMYSSISLGTNLTSMNLNSLSANYAKDKDKDKDKVNQGKMRLFAYVEILIESRVRRRWY
jgi:hypothetical protein